MYQSQYKKWQSKKEQTEEKMLMSSKYFPNEKVLYKNRIFTVKYSEVRDNELVYFCIYQEKPYFLPERLILD